MRHSLGFVPKLCPCYVPVQSPSTTKSVLPEIFPILVTFPSSPPFPKAKNMPWSSLWLVLPLTKECFSSKSLQETHHLTFITEVLCTKPPYPKYEDSLNIWGGFFFCLVFWFFLIAHLLNNLIPIINNNSYNLLRDYSMPVLNIFRHHPDIISTQNIFISLTPLYRWITWGLKRMSHLPKFTRPVRD